MPDIYLFNGSNIAQQNSPFSLIKNGPFYVSNVQQNTTGRWYYEITHVSGPSLYLAGFEFDFGHKFFFSIYPNELLPDSTLFYLGCSVEINSFDPIGMISLKSNSTIGISFDAFTNRIDFRTESEIKGYYITMTNKPKFYRAKIWHADRGDPDTVKVNFGAKPFYYPIPPGYTSLDKGPLICYTLNNQIFGYQGIIGCLHKMGVLAVFLDF